MTPLQIEMLFHIHCRIEPYNDRGGAAQRAAFELLHRNDLIYAKANVNDGAPVYGVAHGTTDKGEAMVEKLCAVTLPVSKTVWE